MWDGADRRRFPRAEYPCLITIRKHTPSPFSILTHTENISLGGMRVIVGKRIEVMTDVDLEIDLMDTLPNVTSDGTVSWVKEILPAQKGRSPSYEIGIQFITLKDEYRRRIQSIIEHLSSKSG